MQFIKLSRTIGSPVEGGVAVVLNVTKKPAVGKARRTH
jgi:hypothetical protein